MLMSYQYRTGKRGTVGWFQCDKADFLKMFRNKKWREDCFWCRTNCNGTIHMWTKKTGWFVSRDEEIDNDVVYGGK